MGSPGKRKNSAQVSKKSDGTQEIFVDREIQRDAFKRNLAELSHEESLVIYYSGAGGIGKTALLDKLKNYLDTKKQIFKYANYSFPTSANMLTMLNELKETLIKNHSVQFPLFEKGCILYSEPPTIKIAGFSGLVNNFTSLPSYPRSSYGLVCSYTSTFTPTMLYEQKLTHQLDSC